VSQAGLRTRTAVLIVLTVIFNATGNLFLSIGMKHVSEVQDWWLARLAMAGRMTATSGTVWLGVGMLALFFISYLLLLSWADYSYVLPASAVGYAIVPLLGYAFAGEQVSSLRWSGVLLICVGVVMVGRTPVRTSAFG
jgi:drug/metabolite transporter (DMT)-like permease